VSNRFLIVIDASLPYPDERSLMAALRERGIDLPTGDPHPVFQRLGVYQVGSNDVPFLPTKHDGQVRVTKFKKALLEALRGSD
jgi:hypothetical protein